MKSEDRIGFGALQVIFCDKDPSEGIQNVNAFVVLSDFGEKWITFGEILDICQKNGYAGGWITVIAENPLSGLVYRYGNHGEGIWEKVGVTMGYAYADQWAD